MDTPPPPSPGSGATPADDAAAKLRGYAERAGTEFQRAVDSHPALDRVPGRSVTLVGLGLVAAAIGLSALPWFSGIGLVWSVVMLAGAGAVALVELAGHGVDVPEEKLPAALRHPLVPAAYAALVLLHAFLLFRVGIVPLTWTAAAGLLAYDQHRRAAAAPDGFVHRFDVRRAWHGYRRNVTAGVGVCLASLFMTWGQTSGYWSGGYSYNYAYRTDGAGNGGYAYDYDYTPMQSYWPGWEVSGRNQSFAMLAVALLLALVLWASLRPSEGTGRLRASAGVAMAGALALFWLLAAKDGAGSLLFLAGLATIGHAAFRIHKGEEAGRFDLETLSARYLGRARTAQG